MSGHAHHHGTHHDHGAHSHDSALGGHHHGTRGRRELRWVMLLSLVYLVAEVAGGYFSHSLALLADAGHMAIDVLAVALGLFAIWVAQKPPTLEKTYGYYRAEILAALLNGATLIAISVWIIAEACQRFRQPEVVEGKLMTVIAAGGLLINLVQLLLLHRRSGDNLNMRGVWLHVVTDTLGSVSAVAAAILVWAFGWNLADPIISIVIATLILFGSWKLLSECVNVLLEGAPKGIAVEAVAKVIRGCAEVKDVHDLHVWMVSSGMNALSAHVRIQEAANPSKVLLELTHVLREKFAIQHTTIQLETEAFTPEDCDTTH